MAQRSKYGVTSPYFGHRKRGCEATSSPFVYLRQSCGDNYCFCFMAVLLAFSIYIKLRRTVFSVRRIFVFTPFIVHFVPHNPCNSFGTSSKKHQSQFKSVSDYFFFFYIIFYSLCEFIYADLILFGNSFGIIFLSLSSFPSLIASL